LPDLAGTWPQQGPCLKGRGEQALRFGEQDRKDAQFFLQRLPSQNAAVRCGVPAITCL
jgi:hypothetical protein